MEMPPDTLAVFGVNEVVATVEPSVTTEQAASVLNSPVNDFFWNEHLNSASRLERVGGWPQNLSSS